MLPLTLFPCWYIFCCLLKAISQASLILINAALLKLPVLRKLFKHKFLDFFETRANWGIPKQEVPPVKRYTSKRVESAHRLLPDQGTRSIRRELFLLVIEKYSCQPVCPDPKLSDDFHELLRRPLIFKTRGLETGREWLQLTVVRFNNI